MDVRRKLLLALVIGGLGCDREIPVTQVTTTVGYKVAGRISDGLGNPLQGVKVKLYFTFDPVDGNAAPSTTFDVTNSVQVIRVTVNDRDNKVIRTLYNGVHSTGSMRVDWNRKDASGNDVPSSVYTIQYIIDNQVRKSYSVTVDKTITALSDSLGVYSIPDKFLPVGFYPVPLYNADSSKYYGQYQIGSEVGLEFITPVRTKSAYVSLTKGYVSQVDVIMN